MKNIIKLTSMLVVLLAVQGCGTVSSIYMSSKIAGYSGDGKIIKYTLCLIPFFLEGHGYRIFFPSVQLKEKNDVSYSLKGIPTIDHHSSFELYIDVPYESNVSDKELYSLNTNEIKILELKIVDKRTNKIIYEVNQGDFKIFTDGTKSEIFHTTGSQWDDDWEYVGNEYKKVGYQQRYNVGDYNFTNMAEGAEPQLTVTFETRRVLPLSTYKIFIINGNP